MTEPKVVAGVGVPPPPEILLDVRNLKTHFHVMDGTVPAVDGISFSLPRGETLDIPPAEIVEGEIWFDGKEILSMPIDRMRRIRGNDMAMIFQEPLTSLNPV